MYFVRHGEAAGNSGGFTQVATTPLVSKGYQQAVNAGITLFENESDVWTLKTWNDIAHFAE